LSPERVTLAAPRHIAGIAARTSNARESDPATAALPGLWTRFAAGPAPASGPPAPVYGVYTEYETDVHGAYTAVVGREGAPARPTERAVTIPAGIYLVFSSAGEVPAAVISGWQQVWAYFARPDAPARAYTADFEYYDPAHPSMVRIHIAVGG
jgi:predicted transcriptional regulator YdeE